ncbi:hypothetical protein TQ38_019875 [Novosphingobium sp. P6W]|nr:hypothetical protein TQ38_019875 [Novosphingobium sp. P6W]
MTQFFQRLTDGGDSGERDGAEREIIVADYGDIAWHGQAGLSRRLQGAQRHQVVAADDHARFCRTDRGDRFIGQAHVEGVDDFPGQRNPACHEFDERIAPEPRG